MVVSSDITACFAENYTQARSRFLSACKTAGADVRPIYTLYTARATRI